MQSILIGSDHRGFELKGKVSRLLSSKGYTVHDVGAPSYNPNDDFPVYVEMLCRKVLGSKGRGILICGSAHGVSIAANKFKGIYASVCWSEQSAIMAKKHENINVLCLPSNFISVALAKRIVNRWLSTPMSKKRRYSKRMKLVRGLEKRNMR